MDERFDDVRLISRGIERACPGSTIARMAPLLDLPGAALQQDARYRYVVETDVEDAAEADFNAWCDRERLPGLAAVPGILRAQRFRRLDGHPRYHLCYDLVAPDAMASPPSLAVRGSAWSGRVRRALRNTTRMMFRRLRRGEVPY
jgi:hypothetical protein